MITAPIKAELLEVFDQAHKDVVSVIRALEDVADLVSVSGRDLRMAHNRVIGEWLGNAVAEIGRMHSRIEEAKTFEDRRKES
ncbi:hypothetical protein AB0E55_09490 [Amycolatopsis keratiniphila]|uniref:hypothetical protein n=1 Tax=Amycolatopsis keratiniphila TaxID=129921 RepID=UPI0033CF83DF